MAARTEAAAALAILVGAEHTDDGLLGGFQWRRRRRPRDIWRARRGIAEGESSWPHNVDLRAAAANAAAVCSLQAADCRRSLRRGVCSTHSARCTRSAPVCTIVLDDDDGGAGGERRQEGAKDSKSR